MSLEFSDSTSIPLKKWVLVIDRNGKCIVVDIETESEKAEGGIAAFTSNDIANLSAILNEFAVIRKGEFHMPKDISELGSPEAMMEVKRWMVRVWKSKIPANEL